MKDDDSMEMRSDISSLTYLTLSDTVYSPIGFEASCCKDPASSSAAAAVIVSQASPQEVKLPRLKTGLRLQALQHSIQQQNFIP